MSQDKIIAKTSSVDPRINSLLDEVVHDLGLLKEELLNEVPNLDTGLSKINENLRQYPELCVLLTEEQRLPLYQALCKKVAITQSNSKSKRKGTKGDTLANGQKVLDLL